MRRQDLARLFGRARELCSASEYVVLGSLSVLGWADRVPSRMAASLDVDAFVRSDPDRVFDLVRDLGQGSPFEVEHGYYLDPVSPKLPTLPEGWEERLVRIELAPGLVAWFLEVNDAAVSKYARLEPRDREWIRPGLSAGIVSLDLLDVRFALTTFADPVEAARARGALEEDRLWLKKRSARHWRRRPPAGPA